MKTLLLIGTRKGGLIASSDASRRQWSLKGPFLKGAEVNHIAHVGNGRLVMAGKSAWWGPAVQISDDAGETWREPSGAIRFDEGRGHSVERIWFIKADPRVPGRLYAGVDPGALFVSDDRGDTWREVPALTDHPTRAKWFPGGGGLLRRVPQRQRRRHVDRHIRGVTVALRVPVRRAPARRRHVID